MSKFSTKPLSAGKMSDAYAKALGGAVTTPDENQRLMRQAGKVPAGIAKGVNSGLAKVLKGAAVMGKVKGRK